MIPNPCLHQYRVTSSLSRLMLGVALSIAALWYAPDAGAQTSASDPATPPDAGRRAAAQHAGDDRAPDGTSTRSSTGTDAGAIDSKPAPDGPRTAPDSPGSSPAPSGSAMRECCGPACCPQRVPVAKKRVVHRKKRRPVVHVETPEPVLPPPPPPVPATRPIGPKPVISILGKKVLGPKGEDLGRVVDVLVNDLGESRAAVIDFGGFLGVGNRKIAVDWSLLQFKPDDAQAPATLHLTREQIQKAPEFKDGAHPDAVLLTPQIPAVIAPTGAPVAIPAAATALPARPAPTPTPAPAPAPAASTAPVTSPQGAPPSPPAGPPAAPAPAPSNAATVGATASPSSAPASVASPSSAPAPTRTEGATKTPSSAPGQP